MTTLQTILPPKRVLFGAAGGSKKQVLKLFSTCIAQDAPKLDDQEVFNRLVARERLGSTGIGNGVAIPHARSPYCDTPLAGFLKLDEAVEFDAIDGNPVDLVFVLLVPEDADDTHLALLAEVAGAMSDAEVRDRLRRCTNQQELHDTLIDAIAYRE